MSQRNWSSRYHAAVSHLNFENLYSVLRSQFLSRWCTVKFNVWEIIMNSGYDIFMGAISPITSPGKILECATRDRTSKFDRRDDRGWIIYSCENVHRYVFAELLHYSSCVIRTHSLSSAGISHAVEDIAFSLYESRTRCETAWLL